MVEKERSFGWKSSAEDAQKAGNRIEWRLFAQTLCETAMSTVESIIQVEALDR